MLKNKHAYAYFFYLFYAVFGYRVCSTDKVSPCRIMSLLPV